jgi:glycosyltransferase involved in cell wall biosynthesis
MEFLARNGHEIRVIDFEARWKPQDLRQSLKTREYQGIQRTNSKGSVRLIRPGMVKLPGVARLSSFGSQFKTIFEQLEWCDVVVLYSVPTNGVQTVISSRLLSKPIVFHSFDVLHRMTGHELFRAPTWTLERFVYPRAKKVVVISAALSNYMKKIGVHDEDIFLLPPAVDTLRFNPTVQGERFRHELGLTAEDRIVLFSGWLYEFAGVDLVLGSFHQLLKEVPKLRLVVCGDGPLLDKLIRMRRELGVENQVHLLGRRPFQQMPEIIAAADVCVNPYLPEVRSVFAFPSKIAEYMAGGKAVVSTDLPGTRSILGPDSGAVLVEPENFVASVRTVLIDDDFRRKHAEQGRRFSENNFSLESVCQKFESVLVDAIRQRIKS